MLSDTELNEFFDNAAKAVARNFPSYVESDDCLSAIWVYFMENEEAVTRLIRNDESWEAKLYGTLVRVATTHALETEADYHGYSTDDAYYYTTAVVKELLKDVFDYEDWQSFSSFGDGQPKSKRQTPTSDRVDMLIDIKAALEKVTERQKKIIVLKYALRLDDEEIADEMEIKVISVQKTLDRAIESLRKKMGKRDLADMRNGWDAREKIYATEGERRSISNAQAIAYQEDAYNG